ncbi:hypothetical protein R6Q57_025581 [Mikania cordata]
MMMSDTRREDRSDGFSELKGYCLQLLQLITNPNAKASTASISHLLQFITRSPSHHLQPFFDYTLFPLLLLLEAAVDCRSPKEEINEYPPKISDAVAEGVIHCLEELFMKCHVGSVDQMVVILKKLTNAALLSPSEASEEFREGIIRCFKALINSLRSCSNTSCTCNQSTGPPMLLDKKYLKSFLAVSQIQELNPMECIIAFLRSQSASVTVGHWLSLLLKAADIEAARGHTGSSRLRVEAFMTLRVLVAKELRHLPGKKQDQVETLATKSTQKSSQSEVKKSLHVDRTRDWIATNSSHVNKILSSVFPHLCVHPAKRVRQGTMAAIRGLLSTCSRTLKGSRLMLLESLCALVSDDDEEVSEAAQTFLENLLSSGNHHIERDFADIFNRLFEKLPEVVIGGEKSLAHSQKLLVLIYYSGPQLVRDHLLHSPVAAAQFFDTLALCLNQNSVYSGSLDKLLLEKQSSVGYLRSITEMKAITFFENEKKIDVESNAYENASSFKTQNEYDLPRMPPWFSSSNQKLYSALSAIIRLVSLSLIAGAHSDGNLSIIKDIPLSYIRKLIDDIRNKEYTNESWQNWYNMTSSGKLVRHASTSACLLNEMIFGLSDQAIDNLKTRFHNKISVWHVSLNKDIRIQLIDCVGSILHEYLSPEIWNLPLEQSSVGFGDVPMHFFQDNAMLHQVMIDGVGIFNLCLKSDFISSGFLHSSLYVLLENLICSNFQIRHASDTVLHVIAATSGCETVGHLVLANSDYVIDSICRQLRYLDLNPHVPSVLAAILSYIGVAHKILPLMDEPVCFTTHSTC